VIIRDSSGNWIVADYGNNRVRRLSPDFSVAATLVGTGTFTTVSITGKPTEVSVWGPVALAFANQNLLYVQDESRMSAVDLEKGAYTLLMGTGGRVTDGPAIDAPGDGNSFAIHQDGRVFFAAKFVSSNSTARVRVFDPVTKLVRNLTPNGPNGLFKGGLHVVMSRDRVLYAIDGEAFRVFRMDVATGAATPVVSFRNLGIKKVTNVVEGPGSTLLIADDESQKVFRLNLAGTGSAAVQAIAGNGVKGTEGLGGPALDAQLAGPYGLYWDDPSGRVYIGERQGSRLLYVDSDGNLKLAAGTAIAGYGGDDKPGPANAIQSRMGTGGGLTADDSGNLYLCENGIGRIRRLNPATGTLVHVADHGLRDGLTTNLAVESFIGGCHSIAFDQSSRALYFFDENRVLRRIDTITGTISTVSPTVFRGSDRALAMLRGNVVFANRAVNGLTMVTPQGVVSTIAGNGAMTGGNPQADTPAAQAVLNDPANVTAAPDGTLYFTTNDGRIIHSLGADGIVRHIGGSAIDTTNAGDGGPVKQATFRTISRLAVDARKRIYVGVENRIRLIDERGNVNRFAGSSPFGFSGDGGNPLGALLWTIGGIAIDASGTLFVSDINNARVRRIGPATAASRFSLTSGNGQILDIGVPSRPLTVEVRTASGQPVPGTVITFRAENGQLSASTAATGPVGEASVVVIAGPAPGPVRVVAVANGLGQLTFDLTAIAGLAITEVVSNEGSDARVAPGSLVRVKVENARGPDESFSIMFGDQAAAVLEGSAVGGSVVVAVPDTLDAGSFEVVAREADRGPSVPLQITLEATAPNVRGCETVEDVVTCSVTGYGRTVDSIPAAAPSVMIDTVEAAIVGYRVKSPGLAELQIRVPEEFVAGGVQELTLVVQIDGSQTEVKVLVGQ